MAKVFATFVENNRVVIKTWSSKSIFEQTESWLDEKFIYAATSADFKGCYSVTPMFEGEYCGMVVQTPIEKEAHALMVDARNKYLKIDNLS
jgi:hypothetical protein